MKYHLWFREDFLDLGQVFPYGEWLKVPSPGTASLVAHPLSRSQPFPNSSGDLGENLRGASILEFGQQRSGGGKENDPNVVRRGMR